MNGKVLWLLSFFCATFFAVPASAQCKNQQDRACWSLQYILYAGQTDFREFRGIPPLKPGDHQRTPPNPDLSVGAIHVPCRADFWLSSEVPVYICSAELPAQEAEEWYAKTMADLQELQYLWQFKSESPGADHYVDAGPQGCEPPQVETISYGAFHAGEPYLASGPYLGQCPMHLQTVRQPDGTARISFWLNSSVNLARNPKPASQSLELSVSAKPEAPQPPSVSVPVPPSASTSASAPVPTAQPAPATSVAATSAAATSAPANPATASPESPAVATRPAAATEISHTEPAADHSAVRSSERYGACDDLCQGLKKVLENRASSFRQLAARNRSSAPSSTASLADLVKLSGAETCSINAEPASRTRSSAGNALLSGPNFVPVSTKDSKSPVSRAPARPKKQYVCYWPQDSESAAETEFHDLAGLLQMLIPTSWSAEQKSELDELSGAQITIWSALDSRNRPVVRMYLTGRSVGLHISSGE
jgi:hypothetical protein